jgi:hypothetical protein
MDEEDNDTTPRPPCRELPQSPTVIVQSDMETASAPDTDQFDMDSQDDGYIATRSPTPRDAMLIQDSSHATTSEQDEFNGAVMPLMEYPHQELITDHIHVRISLILNTCCSNHAGTYPSHCCKHGKALGDSHNIIATNRTSLNAQYRGMFGQKW